MHEKYYDAQSKIVNSWQDQAAPCARFPYGLGLDNDKYVVALGIYPYREIHEDYDKLTQELVPDSAPVIEGDVAILHYRAVSLSTEIIAEKCAASIREERDKRIAATDYLVAADYPLSESARADWTAYRQALRDIPAQPGFPWAGVDDPACPWPATPTTRA